MTHQTMFPDFTSYKNYNQNNDDNACWCLVYPILIVLGALVSQIAGSSGVWTLFGISVLFHAPACLLYPSWFVPMVAIHLLLVPASLQLGEFWFGDGVELH